MKRPQPMKPPGTLLHIIPRSFRPLREALSEAGAVLQSLDGIPLGGWRSKAAIFASAAASNQRQTHDVLSLVSALASLSSEYADAARLIAVASADSPHTLDAVREHTRAAQRCARAAAKLLSILAP